MNKEKLVARQHGGYLEALLQSAPDAVIAIDAKGIIQFVNRACIELLECEMPDVLGKSIVTLYGDEKIARDINRRIYEGGGILRNWESNLKTKAGKVVPVRISAAHLKDSTGNYAGGVGYFQAYRPWTAAEVRTQDYCRELEGRLVEWQELGSPVFELYPGLSMAVVVGRLDSERFAKLKKTLLSHIVFNKTRAALIDLSAAVAGDDHVAAEMVKLIRMIRVVGAQCVIVGIESTKTAEAVEALVPDVASLNTYCSLQAGLEAVLAILGLEICKKK